MTHNRLLNNTNNGGWDTTMLTNPLEEKAKHSSDEDNNDKNDIKQIKKENSTKNINITNKTNSITNNTIPSQSNMSSKEKRKLLVQKHHSSRNNSISSVDNAFFENVTNKNNTKNNNNQSGTLDLFDMFSQNNNSQSTSGLPASSQKELPKTLSSASQSSNKSHNNDNPFFDNFDSAFDNFPKRNDNSAMNSTSTMSNENVFDDFGVTTSTDSNIFEQFGIATPTSVTNDDDKKDQSAKGLQNKNNKKNPKKQMKTSKTENRINENSSSNSSDTDSGDGSDLGTNIKTKNKNSKEEGPKSSSDNKSQPQKTRNSTSGGDDLTETKGVNSNTIDGDKAAKPNTSTTTTTKTTPTPVPVSPTAETPKKKYDVLPELRRGTALLKYGRHGYPHFRQFNLSQDNSKLIWFSTSKKMDQSSISMKEIVQVLTGQHTKEFERIKWTTLTPASFSVIYDRSRKSLNLVAKSVDEMKMWVEALRLLSDLSKKGTDLSKLTKLEVDVDFRDRNRPQSRRHSGNFLRSHETKEREVDPILHQKLQNDLDALRKTYEEVAQESRSPIVQDTVEYHSIQQILSELEERIEELIREVKNTRNTKIAENDVWRTKIDLENLRDKIRVIEKEHKGNFKAGKRRWSVF